jgi:hypothetical protein
MNSWRLIRVLALSASLGAGAPLLAMSGIVTTQETPCAAQASSPRGAWESDGQKTQVLFQGDEIIFRKNGTLSVAKILSREPCRLVVRYQGLKALWSVAGGADGTLELKTDEALKLRPLAAVPPDLDINTSPFPKPGPVTPEEAKAIEKELLARVGKDQEVLKNPALKSKREEVVKDNHAYLVNLTRKLGWIDVLRFGKDAASAAILLAKHSGDLLLLKAAMPIVEADVKEHGGPGEMFSVLYDELQIELGNKQRYGTQIDTDKEGRPFILPLEDLSKVDEFRKEIGILSFEQYRKLASDNMGGITIRVAGTDE